jgi:hypothetical protein
MAIDWSLAPEGAICYANGKFWEEDKDTGKMRAFLNSEISSYVGSDMLEISTYNDFETRSLDWPTDERITAIAQNDGTGEHYDEVVTFVEWSKNDEITKPTQPKTSVEFLNACAAVQSERGKQYDASDTGERSFAAAASAFNAATGKSLTGSDVCLLLTMVKLVRQYSSPERLHHDSLLDGVSYLSLWAEELTKELGA